MIRHRHRICTYIMNVMGWWYLYERGWMSNGIGWGPISQEIKTKRCRGRVKDHNHFWCHLEVYTRIESRNKLFFWLLFLFIFGWRPCARFHSYMHRAFHALRWISLGELIKFDPRMLQSWRQSGKRCTSTLLLQKLLKMIEQIYYALHIPYTQRWLSCLSICPDSQCTHHSNV